MPLGGVQVSSIASRSFWSLFDFSVTRPGERLVRRRGGALLRLLGGRSGRRLGGPGRRPPDLQAFRPADRLLRFQRLLARAPAGLDLGDLLAPRPRSVLLPRRQVLGHAEPAQDRRDRQARPRALRDPVARALGVELEAQLGLGRGGIVVAEGLDRAPVAGVAGVGHGDAEGRAVRAPRALHADDDGHADGLAASWAGAGRAPERSRRLSAAKGGESLASAAVFSRLLALLPLLLAPLVAALARGGAAHGPRSTPEGPGEPPELVERAAAAPAEQAAQAAAGSPARSPEQPPERPRPRRTRPCGQLAVR